MRISGGRFEGKDTQRRAGTLSSATGAPWRINSSGRVIPSGWAAALAKVMHSRRSVHQEDPEAGRPGSPGIHSLESLGGAMVDQSVRLDKVR